MPVFIPEIPIVHFQMKFQTNSYEITASEIYSDEGDTAHYQYVNLQTYLLNITMEIIKNFNLHQVLLQCLMKAPSRVLIQQLQGLLRPEYNFLLPLGCPC